MFLDICPAIVVFIVTENALVECSWRRRWARIGRIVDKAIESTVEICATPEVVSGSRNASRSSRDTAVVTFSRAEYVSGRNKRHFRASDGSRTPWARCKEFLMDDRCICVSAIKASAPSRSDRTAQTDVRNKCAWNPPPKKVDGAPPRAGKDATLNTGTAREF